MLDGLEDVVVVDPWAGGSSARPVGGSGGMVWCFLRVVARGGAGGVDGSLRARCAVPRHLLSPLWSWWVALVWWSVCAGLFGLGGGCPGLVFLVGGGFWSWCRELGGLCVSWPRLSGWCRAGAAAVVGAWRWCAVGLSCGDSLLGGLGGAAGGDVLGRSSGSSSWCVAAGGLLSCVWMCCWVVALVVGIRLGVVAPGGGWWRALVWWLVAVRAVVPGGWWAVAVCSGRGVGGDGAVGVVRGVLAFFCL